MRKRAFGKGVALILSAIMVLGSVSVGFSAAGSESTNLTSGSFSYVRSKTFEELVGGKAAPVRSDRWYYSNDWFDGQAWEGANDRLAVLSLQLAMSTQSNGDNWYEHTEAFLRSMGFSNIEAYSSEDSAASKESWKLLIGSKNVRNSDGTTEPLIVVLPQSAAYRAEWAGNFNIGDSGAHEGFEYAASRALESLSSYTTKYNIAQADEAKYWIAGHSRGAAIANLLGAYITSIVAMAGDDSDTYSTLISRYNELAEAASSEQGAAGSQTSGQESGGNAASGQGAEDIQDDMDSVMEKIHDYLANAAKDVYVYTFACPNVSELSTGFYTTSDDDSSYYIPPADDLYENIHNYLNKGDIVTLVPPTYFGSSIAVSENEKLGTTFGRYGENIEIGSSSTRYDVSEGEILSHLRRMNPDMAIDFEKNGMQSGFSEAEIKAEVEFFGQKMDINDIVGMLAGSVTDPDLWKDYGNETTGGESGLSFIIDLVIDQVFAKISDEYADDASSDGAEASGSNAESSASDDAGSKVADGNKDDILGLINEVIFKKEGSELTQSEFLNDRMWNGIYAGLMAKAGTTNDNGSSSGSAMGTSGSESGPNTSVSSNSAVPREVYYENYQNIFVTLASFITDGLDEKAANDKTLERFKTKEYYEGEELSVKGFVKYLNKLKEAGDSAMDEETNVALYTEIKGYLKNIITSTLCMYFYCVTDQRDGKTGGAVERMLDYISEAESEYTAVTDSGEADVEAREEALAKYFYFCYVLDQMYDFVNFESDSNGDNKIKWEQAINDLSAYDDNTEQEDNVTIDSEDEGNEAELSNIVSLETEDESNEGVLTSDDETGSNDEESTMTRLEYLISVYKKLKAIVEANKTTWQSSADSYSQLSQSLLDLAAKNMTELLEGTLSLLKTDNNTESYNALYKALVEHENGKYNNGALQMAKLLAYTLFGLDEWTVYESGSAASSGSTDEDTIWSEALNNLATLYYNVYRIAYAHYADTYLAWLMAADEGDLYTRGIQNNSSRSGSSSKSNESTTAVAVNQGTAAEENTAEEGSGETDDGEGSEAGEIEGLVINEDGSTRIGESVAGFEDVGEGNWFAEAVKEAVESGLFKGVSENRFDPQGTATREQVMTVLARYAGLENADISAGTAWAVENGISDGTDPKGAITREQFVTMLYRQIQAQGGGFTGEWMFLLENSDASEVSSWADEAMHFCVMSGIITGYEDGSLRPQAEITRAQMAAIMQRVAVI